MLRHMFCCWKNQHDGDCIVNGYDSGEPLFDPRLITDIDWTTHSATFRDDVSPHRPGLNLAMRPLSVDDFDKGSCF